MKIVRFSPDFFQFLGSETRQRRARHLFFFFEEKNSLYKRLSHMLLSLWVPKIEFLLNFEQKIFFRKNEAEKILKVSKATRRSVDTLAPKCGAPVPQKDSRETLLKSIEKWQKKREIQGGKMDFFRENALKMNKNDTFWVENRKKSKKI